MTKKTNKPGLYIHIPFCDHICNYCGFSKLFYDASLVDRYLDQLEKEASNFEEYTVDSIYIGGGTPSSLSLSQLDKLFNILERFKHSSTFITFEANPDITYEKLEFLAKKNVGRISLGVQTFNKKFQKIINRHHQKQDIQKLVDNCHLVKLDNINLDIIYGFEGQTLEDLKRDLEIFTSFDIKHISSYCLQIEEGTILKLQKYNSTSDENSSNLYNYLVTYLKNKNFNRYEVSNFSKPGFESQHNLIYWNNEEYLGIGLSSSSYLNQYRRTNTKSITNYLKGQFNDYEEFVDEENKEFYFIMLGLRKQLGIDLEEYQKTFNQDFLVKYQEKLKKEFDLHNIEIKNNHLKIADDKFFIMDFILRNILF